MLLTNPKLISIIIPSYNYASKLSRAVLSVLNQKTDAIELIVVDDGSTDETQVVLEKLKEKNEHSFVSVLQENRGAAGARNHGISLAKGQYIWFLDADDALEDGAAQTVVEHIKQNPESLFIIAAYQSIWPDEQKVKFTYPKKLPTSACARLKAYLLDKNISLANGATIFHNSLFDKGLFPEHFRNAEDIPIFAQAITSDNCTILPQSIAKIYKSEQSLRHNVDYDRQVGLLLIRCFSS